MYRVRRRNLSPQRRRSDLLGGIDVSIHRLSVLLGEEPDALRSELEKTNPIPPLDRKSMSVCLPIS